MQAFLSIYSMIDWALRGASMAAQALAVGGAAYILFTLSRLKSEGLRAPLERFCKGLLFWSATATCVSELLAACALTAFLVGSTGAPLRDAASADAVLNHLASAGAAFVLAFLARGRSVIAPPALVALSLLLVGAHAGITHAASRTEPSLSLLAAESLHLLALATWIGGIPYFIASLRLIGDDHERRSVARRFSSTSLVSVAILVATGAFMAIPYTGSFEALYQTTYGLLLGAKVVLLSLLLCLGAANFLAIRGERREKSTLLRSVPVFGEIEIGIGLIAILCAVALASSPLAVSTEAARPQAPEISTRFQLAWPRLQAPAYSQLAAAQTKSPVATDLSALEASGGNEADKAWSEANHHYAALVVILMGLVALSAHSRRLRPVARHWPLLFLGLAAYLVVAADEEAWPLGKIGFFQSLATPQIAQHKAMIALIAGFGACEWSVQSQRAKAAWASYVFPLAVAAAAAFLLTHYGHTGRKEEVLIEISHTPIALLGVIVASARWMELRLAPTTASRIAGFVWPLALIAAGSFLLLYREVA
jgi:putative copper resistance protein D